MSGLPKNIKPGDQPGSFVITPDPGKWYTIAAGGLLFGFVSTNWFMGLAVAGFAAAMAYGKLTWIRVSRDGLKVRIIFVERQYRWDDISEFTYKSSGFGWYRQQLIMFSNLNKSGIMANMSKFVAGGTESMPVIGVEADKLVRILNKARMEYADPMRRAQEPVMTGSRAESQKPQRIEAPQPVLRAMQKSAPTIEAPRVVRQPSFETRKTNSRDPIDSRQKPLIS